MAPYVGAPAIKARRLVLAVKYHAKSEIRVESTEHDPSTGSTPRIQTNFKHCIHILQRSLEELLLLTTEMQTAVQRAFDAIVWQYQTVRPGRSYPRQSFKPDFRWRPAKEKRKRRQKELAPAATA